MSTLQYNLVCDNSTYANYSQWASAISGAFASFGWVQTSDTGQVMWSGMSLTAVAMSSSNATYTYTSLTGLALAVGRVLTITGMTHSANNGAFVITALGTGTFTVVNASGVAESGSTGVVTQGSTVPGNGAFFYELWQPNDGLTNFYLKTEYGNGIAGNGNTPAVRLTVAVSTNGAGTVTGTATSAIVTIAASYSPPSTTTQYECDFSGTTGRFAAMMWRNGTNGSQQLLAVERSLNSSGTYTSSHVTIILGGNAGSGTSGFQQQSYVFGVGAGPTQSSRNGARGLLIRVPTYTTTSAFNGALAFDTVAPLVGGMDYPLTVVGAGVAADFAEGVTFAATVYGSTRTYMPSGNGSFAQAGRDAVSGSEIGAATMVCIRYD